MSKKNPRIALCFHGIHGILSDVKSYEVSDFEKGTNGSDINVLRMVHKNIKKNILDVNKNVDVFFHTWDVDFEPEMVELYKPKGYIFEPQVFFETEDFIPQNKRGQAHFSRWYSFNKCNKLKKEYEKENNFRYDYVIQQRLDLLWLGEIPIKTGEHILGLPDNRIWEKDTLYTPGGGAGPNEIPDRYFIGNSHQMDIIADLIHNINDYTDPNGARFIYQYGGISSHFMIVQWLKDNKLEHKRLWTYPTYHCLPRDLNEKRRKEFQ